MSDLTKKYNDTIEVLKNSKADNVDTIRHLNISVCKKGGSTASQNSLSYRLILPAAWMSDMNIDSDSRQVLVSYDPALKTIFIKKEHIE